VSRIHAAIGFAVVALFALGWLWGLGSRVARREPGPWFWRLVAAQQVGVGIQAILGLALFVLGHRVVSPGILGGLRHYVYGLLPIVILSFAHLVAREGNASVLGFDPRKPVAPWVPFAWASFICFGLTFMALATGLGIR
jgi:hypothetical protein